jgi:hypothetical protein
MTAWTDAACPVAVGVRFDIDTREDLVAVFEEVMLVIFK